MKPSAEQKEFYKDHGYWPWQSGPRKASRTGRFDCLVGKAGLFSQYSLFGGSNIYKMEFLAISPDIPNLYKVKVNDNSELYMTEENLLSNYKYLGEAF